MREACYKILSLFWGIYFNAFHSIQAHCHNGDLDPQTNFTTTGQDCYPASNNSHKNHLKFKLLVVAVVLALPLFPAQYVDHHSS